MKRLQDLDDGNVDGDERGYYDEDADAESADDHEHTELRPGDTRGCDISVPLSPPMEWKYMRIGQTIIEVSSYGLVKPYKDLFASSTGIHLPGTPYRVYQIEGENYMMHQLVWRAFHGPVPEGWEVRHADHYVRFQKHRLYSNALWNLSIYPVCMARPNI